MTRKEYNNGVKLWAGDVYRYAAHCCSDPETAKDGVQEATAALWEHRDRVSTAAPPPSSKPLATNTRTACCPTSPTSPHLREPTATTPSTSTASLSPNPSTRLCWKTSATSLWCRTA